ncbi:hypothetical protein [Paenibacillus sp. P22]|uniref:hypothetical protein n=1 Tax=Paenibacillus sp. P22 TaxID=483908 RepID=UPI00038F4D8F|nr:hypothetical protein [Paenibacillus sp. P22]CDN41109.1 hypothetical protein BN871_AC_00030 [Paenibacillus sp. P22]
MNKKLLATAVGAGVTYLMRNKPARDKLFSTVKSLASGAAASRPAATGTAKPLNETTK